MQEDGRECHHESMHVRSFEHSNRYHHMMHLVSQRLQYSVLPTYTRTPHTVIAADSRTFVCRERTLAMAFVMVRIDMRFGARRWSAPPRLGERYQRRLTRMSIVSRFRLIAMSINGVPSMHVVIRRSMRITRGV